MTDLVWPDDLPPFQQSFYLQPHVIRSESPFNRQTKIYGLSRPRWICKMAFRGGYDGTVAQAAFGPRLDALIAQLEGGATRIAIPDFRRMTLRGVDVTGAGNEAADAGDTTMTLTGLVNGETVLAGDYIGGDGRPHIILADVPVDYLGQAVVTFKPALEDDIAEDEATLGTGAGWFRLTSDDAGENATEVGGPTIYNLEFVEDLNPSPDLVFEEEPLTYTG